MSKRIIEWRFMPPGEGWDDYESDVVVWLDVPKVDAAWKRSDQYVLPGGANGQDKRYTLAGTWFAQYPFSNMLVINLEPDGSVTFTDGRHRFSWLRDHGANAIAFQVSPVGADQCLEMLGTDLRKTIVAMPD